MIYKDIKSEILRLKKSRTFWKGSHEKGR